jgi:hypothetical protein
VAVRSGLLLRLAGILPVPLVVLADKSGPTGLAVAEPRADRTAVRRVSGAGASIRSPVAK